MLISSAVPSSIHTEHAVLCRSLGAAQQRCSRVMAEQAAQIKQLEAQLLRLRARMVSLQSEGARAVPQVRPPLAAKALAVHPLASAARASFHAEWAETNEVICQVACLSHGAYWRDSQSQCRRSGEACTALTGAEAKQELPIR